MSATQTEAERWRAAAGEELATARHLAAGGFHAAACFHAQQAAEKAVKAAHYARGARTVLGHSVRALIESLDPRLPALDGVLDAARELDLLYVPTRYPNGLAAGTPGQAFSAAQAERAIRHAQAVLAAAGGEGER
jgi:HEPN domain-containing protein